jgi:2-polyprenyl-3-methyl-5-hydroxy-6-metoxy-1,4-benzoquinol methylase
MEQQTYEQQLKQEAQVWGRIAREQAAEAPPEWAYQRKLRHNLIVHTADIDTLLTHIRPGMNVLELGCNSGWLTLAMAQNGAIATGMDISEEAVAIARNYYQQVKERVQGSVSYQIADLNALQLQPDTYDVIIVKGTLHHLVELQHVILQIKSALKPQGLLWVSDAVGDEQFSTVLAASALMFVLPTVVSYGDKIRGLLRFGLRAPSRIRASMEAEGLSPFEGAGREHDWVKLLREHFTVEKEELIPSLTGYITAQLKAPDAFAIPFLHWLYGVDKWLTQNRILKSTGLIVYARKRS